MYYQLQRVYFHARNVLLLNTADQRRFLRDKAAEAKRRAELKLRSVLSHSASYKAHRTSKKQLVDAGNNQRPRRRELYPEAVSGKAYGIQVKSAVCRSERPAIGMGGRARCRRYRSDRASRVPCGHADGALCQGPGRKAFGVHRWCAGTNREESTFGGEKSSSPLKTTLSEAAPKTALERPPSGCRLRKRRSSNKVRSTSGEPWGDADPKTVASLERILSDEERKRAGRFRFDKDRIRYTLSYGNAEAHPRSLPQNAPRNDPACADRTRKTRPRSGLPFPRSPVQPVPHKGCFAFCGGFGFGGRHRRGADRSRSPFGYRGGGALLYRRRSPDA